MYQELCVLSRSASVSLLVLTPTEQARSYFYAYLISDEAVDTARVHS